MHPVILGGGLLLAAATGLAAASPAACPGSTAKLVERFIAADCTACWAEAPRAMPAPHTAPGTALHWTLDWLLPRDPADAMSAAALPAAAERAQRLGRPASGPTAPPQMQADRPASPARPGLRLQVQSGPAWQGYFGLQLRVSVRTASRLPAGSTAWLALVEQIPAGQEGSAQPRQLVRNVAGPLPLQALQAGRPLSHLQALRWPEGAQPERLRARGWIEAPDGQVIAMAADRCD